MVAANSDASRRHLPGIEQLVYAHNALQTNCDIKSRPISGRCRRTDNSRSSKLGFDGIGGRARVGLPHRCGQFGDPDMAR